MYYFNKILKLEPVSSRQRQFHWGIWERQFSFWSQPLVHNSAGRPIFMKITGLEGEKSHWPMPISNSYLLLKADEWVLHWIVTLKGPCEAYPAIQGKEHCLTLQDSISECVLPQGYRMLLRSPHLWPTLSYLTTAKQVTWSSRWSHWHSEVCVSYTHHATGKSHISTVWTYVWHWHTCPCSSHAKPAQPTLFALCHSEIFHPFREEENTSWHCDSFVILSFLPDLNLLIGWKRKKGFIFKTHMHSRCFARPDLTAGSPCHSQMR